VDVLFITPWLLEMAQKSNLKLNAEQLVVHHHRSGEKVECSGCVVPAQGQEILIEN
jgi:hypothetical protein